MSYFYKILPLHRPKQGAILLLQLAKTLSAESLAKWITVLQKISHEGFSFKPLSTAAAQLCHMRVARGGEGARGANAPTDRGPSSTKIVKKSVVWPRA